MVRSSYDEASDRQRREAYERDAARGWAKPVLAAVLGVIVFVFVIWIAFALIRPKLKAYSIETERKAQVSRAESDGKARIIEATATAEADRLRASGTADANKTIAGSLTPEYITWLYVDQLDRMPQGTIIYVPTEGGLPVLEAGRGVTAPTGGE